MPVDYSGSFNTPISPEEEAAFQKWAGPRASDLSDYDLRGAWKAGATASPNGHLPDTFKKPNHPTFSNESKYSSEQTPGGEWVDKGDGKWAFKPTPYNIQAYGEGALENYFRENEPEATLEMAETRSEPKAWSGWNLPDAASLPASRSAGPETWSEAWTTAAGTTDETMRVIENLDASAKAQRSAYQAYIDEVEQATGVRLKNPADVDLQRGAFEARPNPQYGTGTGAEWIDEKIRAANEEFEAGRSKLAAQFPAQARLIELDIEGRVIRQMKDAEKKNMEALQSPELGMAGRLSAQLVGGLTGSGRDPYQWMMAVTGAGGGVGRTVAGRIGSTMLTEALLNGGQEAILQAASQDRKKRAGLEHGLNDALANIGIAATFGSLFGGTVQGGAELARIYKMGKGGDQVAARVLEGRPEPGDVETMAKALGVDLAPDKLDAINRSFEESVLDDYMVSSDATPAQIEVMQAAERYAADPDNFPPPEIIERMLVEQEAGRLPTMRPEDYERIYGGDQNAIDDISDTFFAASLDDPAQGVGRSVETAPLEIEKTEQLVKGDDDLIEGFLEAEVRQRSALTVKEQAKIDKTYAEGLGDDVSELVARGAVPASRDLVLYRGIKGEARDGEAFVSASFSRNTASYHASGGSLERYVVPKGTPIYSPRSEMWGGEVLVRQSDLTSISDGSPRGARLASSDPLEGQKIRPRVTAEPLDDAAMRAAEARAGEIAEPARDQNGNPENYLDFIAIEDGDGKVSVVSVREALEVADEPDFLADVLEACKL